MKREERLNDKETSLRLALDGRQAAMWTSLPGQIVSVNLEDQTVSVQPTIQAIFTDEEGIDRNITLPLLEDVPIVWPRAGGYAMTFPIKKDDEVLVVFSSRSIDAWWQSAGVQAQVEKRMHDLSDAFAILAPTSQPNKLDNISSSSVQLRNDSGDVFIEIDDNGKVRVKCSEASIEADNTIDITAPTINLNGNVNIDGNVAVDGDVDFTGNLNVDGDGDFTGEVDAESGLISSGKAFNSHIHGGVEPGGGSTTPPE